MTASLIPAIIFGLILLFAPSNNSEKIVKEEKKSQETPIQLVNYDEFIKDNSINYKAIENNKSNEDLDYKTIYQFIKNNYKKIQEEDAKKITKHLIDYGKRYNVDPKFAAALIARESSFKKDAVSVTGAKGLGQIKEFNYPHLEIEDPFSINQNVKGTIQYMRKMIGNWKKQSEKSISKKDPDKLSAEQIRLALASYYKGFTAVKTKGIDKNAASYVDDIVANYKKIVEYQKNLTN